MCHDQKIMASVQEGLELYDENELFKAIGGGQGQKIHVGFI